MTTEEAPVKRPVRFFNTTGPCNPWDHYMLPPADRLIGAQLDRYIGDKLYWVMHAPRQTGKTTFLLNWAREINAGWEAAACYVSVETCQGVDDWARAAVVINNAACAYSEYFGLPVPKLPFDNPESLLYDTMNKWAELVAPKPLTVLFDEVDVMRGETLIRFLRQLRAGFAIRKSGVFPTSIALVGMRDLKDYITAAKDGAAPNPGSPFNIKADSVLMGNFSKDDMGKLFAQRTEDTGQRITDEAVEYAWEQSMGQPWIVNSLFMRSTMRVLKPGDYSTVTLEHIKTAREQMILARETHLDALAVRLREPLVRKVMETFFSGGVDMELAQSDAFRVCLDLGLVRLNGASGPQIANPIYREVLAREITFGPQYAIPGPEDDKCGWPWLRLDGTLDMDGLLKGFQAFWRKHSDIWEEKSDYTEAFPHLLLMAFLQRVLNGGGHIEREYAAGRGRMDIAIEYGGTTYIIEIKLIRSYDTPEEIRTDGLRQTARYRDKFDKNAPAYLVIFDRRPGTKQKTWDEKISWETENGIAVLRC